MDHRPCILYCNCTYANVVPEDVKREVLSQLCSSDVSFEAVADLCDMSARKDPALKRIADAGHVRIAACYPRAVQWLFHQAGTPLSTEGVTVANMREANAETVVQQLMTSPTSSAEEPA